MMMMMMMMMMMIMMIMIETIIHDNVVDYGVTSHDED